MTSKEIATLASDLAEARGIEEIESPEYIHKPIDVYSTDDVYTEEFKLIYKRWFAHYYDLIEESVGIDLQ